MEASHTHADQKVRFEVPIFVNPKEAKNVPAELKEKIREDEQRKEYAGLKVGNALTESEVFPQDNRHQRQKHLRCGIN